MSTSLENVRFDLGQTVSEHHKAFTNFMDYQTQKFSNNIFFRYYSLIDGKPGFKTLTYAQVDHLATNLACKWFEYTKGLDTVGFIADHSVHYGIAMIAFLKLRTTMLCLSPRNSEAADVNLLEKTNCKLLIVNEKYDHIAKNTAAQVPGVKTICIQNFDIEELLKEPLNPNAVALIDTKFSDEDITKAALIIHSSGSTSFPKPIYLSNRYLFNMVNPFHLSINNRKDLKKINENDVFLSCAPLFHIFGFFTTFTMATVGGSIVFLEKLPPSQEDISFALGYNKCTTMCAPPLILEQMINYLKETNDYSKVNALNYVVFGGAPLKHEAGEWLHAHGVNVRDMYGSTEIGGIMSADMDPKSKNWGSIRAFGADEEGKPYCVFEVNDPADPTVFHLYIRGDSPTLANGVANRPDGGYDTNDLFLEDSHFPGYYIYQGRRDDVLIMENGEKTNPVPMESAIRQFPIVSQVAVIGSGRQLTAALVSLDTQYALNMTPEEMINAVHDAVKEANKECPNHSTILPQMVKILPLNKQLPSTDKGTVMRKKAELQFKDVVEKLYKNFLDGPVRSETNNEDVSTWKHEQTKNFLIESVSKVLNMPTSTFKDRNQSLFDFGLNSLTSIQFRNMIAQYFDDVAQNFIFQHPTINSLCDALMSNETEDALEQTEQRYEQTQKLAQEYLKKANKDFGVAKNNYDESKPKVVFLTGATGSLGSFMLRDLLNDPTVKKVYCAVRGKKEQLYNRLIEAFESRSLDVSLLEDTDRVEALSMNFSEPYLGYGKELYEQLKEEVTIIQHCAWLLNFNMPVDHFDNECIAPFYNLLKFAYKDVNPMHVHFISSISASAGAGAEIEEIPLPLDSHVTMPMGYAQSKFVVEILFNFLTTQKNFPCYIERLGQVCGDSVNGVWNVSEQYPLMFIGGGSIMHKMPELDTVIDWITVDYAAASIVDIMLRTANLNANQGQSIYHIVNPRIVHWSDILDSMKASGMKFDVVSPNEWVETLSKDDTNPSFRLMSFYESNFNESFKMPIWQTEKTKEVTPIIENSPVLDANLFTKFLQRWESVGFYDPSM